MNNQNESALTIPYVKVGDYYFPNLSLPPDAGDIGFWGRRRKEFLREHRPVTFNQLVLSGELFKYLAFFNQEATERLESLIQDMKVAQGFTEELKSRDQMAWVGAMNPSAIPRHKTGRWLCAAIASNSNARQALPDLQIRACVEEIVYAELVYV